ncbi:MAG: hypothetical protein QOI83_2772 [Streptomycetaceae bacterium]|jgi:hypothetical protein|nr:hypothetical protein [Streptomycetaceae bacterium]
MSNARRFLERLVQAEEASLPIPEMTPPTEHRRLCVGMATFDDFDGVWFTIQTIRMFHPELADRISFLVVDNHPEGPAAASLEGLGEWVPFFRYIPFQGYRGTSVRDLIFREANADIVCCVDSHVLIQPGALAALVRWFDEHPDSMDMVQGPLLGDRFDGPTASHFDPVWGSAMYGQWGLDDRAKDPDGEPFEIAMQGLGLFACRRGAWPGLNPRFRGFGAEEGYLHEKVRQAGGRVLCHPAVGWAHRFGRPGGAPYRPKWEDRLRNYLIGWNEIGWDTSGVEEHYREEYEKMGAAANFDAVFKKTASEAANPFSFFDGVFCLNLDSDTVRWAQAARRHEQLGIAWQVERFPAVATPENHHRGCAMSFRRMVAEAKRRGYEHVLILEDDAVFIDDTAAVMQAAGSELANLTWDVCYLGACVWARRFPFLDGSEVLQECGPVTCTHAVAVHRDAYDRILADIPEPGEEFDQWIGEWRACDQYLHRRIKDGTFRAVITSPRVASQPVLLNFDEADRELADRYTI